MSKTAARETMTLVIGKSEALILFDFLPDFHHESSLQVNANAERLATYNPFYNPASNCASQLLKASRSGK